VARELNKAADKAANEGVDAWLMSNIAPDSEEPDPSLWE
jgi:hypothetical protein